MSELETIRHILEAISPEQFHDPGMPMAVALQESHDLHVVLESGDTWNRVVAVGVDPTTISDLPVALGAARQAQSQWVVVRDRSKPEAQRERETAGQNLRTELVAACRWNLRADARAQAVLDHVIQGDGTADLVQDLLDLAALLDRHTTAFDTDETFDAPAQAEAARTLAAEITAGVRDARVPGEQQATKLLRDRAFTHLDRLVIDLRKAGRYAFRKEPERAAAFSSDHLRRVRAKARRRAGERAETATPAASTEE